MDDLSLERARAAKQRALAVFSKFGKVVGIGLTTIDDEYGLKINFDSAPKDLSALPREVDGVVLTDVRIDGGVSLVVVALTNQPAEDATRARRIGDARVERAAVDREDVVF